ncbi:MAG TPA: FAD:protein FMN transferase [Bacteroidales bacterium]|jgi:thiamine biosynthesis lipoprotein|nr:FAD:protein FMN transferase [Bacteroidales bacterium]
MTGKVSGYIPVLALSFLLSCTKLPPRIESFNGFAQGTTYSVVYDDNRKFEPSELREQVEKILRDFDMSLSLYKDSSILCRVNRNEDVKVDTYFTESFKKSLDIYRMTGGAFDITVGPLVRAWGFGPDEHRNFTERKRDSLLRLVGMDKISLRDGKVVKADTGIKLDFNAIAQGYSVDVVCDYLKSRGLKNYLVEIGGEVRAVGKKGDEKWRIGIDRPEENNFTPGEDLEAIISISDESLATSGNYRKFYVENGIKYSHTINPKTGYPAKNNLLSATILASDCGTADGIATACMVMGKENAVNFINEHPEFRAFFVYSDEKGNFRTWLSPELQKMISDIQDN